MYVIYDILTAVGSLNEQGAVLCSSLHSKHWLLKVITFSCVVFDILHLSGTTKKDHTWALLI